MGQRQGDSIAAMQQQLRESWGSVLAAAAPFATPSSLQDAPASPGPAAADEAIWAKAELMAALLMLMPSGLTRQLLAQRGTDLRLGMLTWEMALSWAAQPQELCSSATRMEEAPIMELDVANATVVSRQLAAERATAAAQSTPDPQPGIEQQEQQQPQPEHRQDRQKWAEGQEEPASQPPGTAPTCAALPSALRLLENHLAPARVRSPANAIDVWDSLLAAACSPAAPSPAQPSPAHAPELWAVLPCEAPAAAPPPATQPQHPHGAGSLGDRGGGPAAVVDQGSDRRGGGTAPAAQHAAGGDICDDDSAAGLAAPCAGGAAEDVQVPMTTSAVVAAGADGRLRASAPRAAATAAATPGPPAQQQRQQEHKEACWQQQEQQQCQNHHEEQEQEERNDHHQQKHEQHKAKQQQQQQPGGSAAADPAAHAAKAVTAAMRAVADSLAFVLVGAPAGQPGAQPDADGKGARPCLPVGRAGGRAGAGGAAGAAVPAQAADRLADRLAGRLAEHQAQQEAQARLAERKEASSLAVRVRLQAKYGHLLAREGMVRLLYDLGLPVERFTPQHTPYQLLSSTVADASLSKAIRAAKVANHPDRFLQALHRAQREVHDRQRLLEHASRRAKVQVQHSSKPKHSTRGHQPVDLQSQPLPQGHPVSPGLGGASDCSRSDPLGALTCALEVAACSATAMRAAEPPSGLVVHGGAGSDQGREAANGWVTGLPGSGGGSRTAAGAREGRGGVGGELQGVVAWNRTMPEVAPSALSGPGAAAGAGLCALGGVAPAAGADPNMIGGGVGSKQPHADEDTAAALDGSRGAVFATKAMLGAGEGGVPAAKRSRSDASQSGVHHSHEPAAGEGWQGDVRAAREALRLADRAQTKALAELVLAEEVSKLLNSWR